jgi:hypothetical protein
MVVILALVKICVALYGIREKLAEKLRVTPCWPTPTLRDKTYAAVIQHSNMGGLHSHLMFSFD